MATTALSRDLERKALKRDLARARTDLRFLAVDVLGYDLMAGSWHTEIFKWADSCKSRSRVALFAPREMYKSRLEVAEIIQQILCNQDIKIGLIHHKLELALELVTEAGEFIIGNDRLRDLLKAAGYALPTKDSKTFIKTSQGGQFTMPGCASKAKPTLRGMSADSDYTGAHPHICFLDDVISAKTVEFFGGIEGIRNWIRHTVIPMVGAAGKIRVKGTMWSGDDWYGDIMSGDEDSLDQKHKWHFQRRGIMETDGVPDYQGAPIDAYVRDLDVEDGSNRRKLNESDIARMKREMLSHFPNQMMNDPNPKEGMPWHPETCEHYVKVAQIKKYVKQTVILMDPAPLGMDNSGQLVKKDGSKNYWAIAVVGFCKSKDRTIRILLDGSASQEWSLDEGLNECKRLMNKWRAKVVGIEEPLAHGGIGFYARDLKAKFGKSEMLMGQKVRPVKFASTRNGKGPRIMDLASMAGMTDEHGDSDPLFFINNDANMNREFLQMFLQQIRNWAGKGTIRFDDHLDAVSYLCDPAIVEALRLGSVVLDADDAFSQNGQPVRPQPRLTLHCGI